MSTISVNLSRRLAEGTQLLPIAKGGCDMTKRMMSMLLLVLVCLAWSSAATAAAKKKGGAPAKTVVLTPDQMQWKEPPQGLPNTQVAVLEGDPAQPGFFVIRLKIPAGSKIPPHVHDNVERVTVISGSVNLAMGSKAENPQVLPTGSYFSIPPRTVHNAWVDQETVLQIATNGPWTFRPVGKPGAGMGDDSR
jgi:quercetin dioxygenase-like cupin family protein